MTERADAPLPMSTSSSPAVLNENQARRIAATFSYIDGLLRNVERLSQASIRSTGQRSPFNREQPDLTDTEANLVLSLVDAARRRMLATMDHLGLPHPAVDLSARWTIMTAFRFIDISLSELTPQTLRGYGDIDARSAGEVVAVAGELRELIARGRALLQPHEGERLRERVAAIAGPFGDVLRVAEALSTQHGLVEVRQLIAAAADRAETSTIDIGVFGRVSSGKSSLINALVGEPILPVGATPVTAVPLRVVHGAEAIEVCFMDGHRTSISPAELPAFATEAGNRDNVQHVESILIRTPNLADGLALLDTPGVGSLSQSGPAQAFAWLPRCDLGLVLVAAGTPLGRDELALVSGLTQAGIAVEVLLSKSDLISTSERSAAVEYVQREVARAVGGANVIVRPISVMTSDRELLEQWRQHELDPRVASRQRVAELARARRVRALLGSLNAAMAELSTLDPSRIDVQRARVDTEAAIGAAADELESSVRNALRHATEAVTAAWQAGTDGRAAARQALLDAPNRALFRVRAAADHILDVGGDGHGDAAGRIPPLFDPPFLDDLPVSPRPSVLDRLMANTRAEQQLARVAGALDNAYGTYANRIRAWGLERLRENLERVTSMGFGDTTELAPDLRALAAMIDRTFPKQTE